MDASNSLLTYWYFHLPNFILAVLMYTLLGRALLGLIVQPNSSNYIWRFFCRITDPVVAVFALVTPKAAAPVVVWLFGVCGCSGCAPCSCSSVHLARPVAAGRELTMERNWYYIGIAFFGMVNGIFNPLMPLAYVLSKVMMYVPLFGSEPLIFYFASLMLSTATIILGGIPAAIHERLTGAKEDSTAASLWIWLAGTAVLALLAMGNFFTTGL